MSEPTRSPAAASTLEKVFETMRFGNSSMRETSDVPERQAPAVDPVVRLDVRQALDRLTPRERQLIWLAHVEGADHREIATALDLRAGSVRVLLWRTRRKLARWLRRASDSGQDVP